MVLCNCRRRVFSQSWKLLVCRRNFSAGLSKYKYRCPEEHFGENYVFFFGRKFFLSSTSGIRRKIFSGRFAQSAFKITVGTFWVNLFREKTSPNHSRILSDCFFGLLPTSFQQGCQSCILRIQWNDLKCNVLFFFRKLWCFRDLFPTLSGAVLAFWRQFLAGLSIWYSRCPENNLK